MILRLKAWALHNLAGIVSPSLAMLGRWPTLSWVATGKAEDMAPWPHHGPPLEDLMARVDESLEMTMGDHIEATKAAALRTDERLGELVALYNPHTGHCCPGCASPEYRELTKKQDRRLAWLTIMLRKRGWLDDLKLAEQIELERWP